jgi:hypothetical protein
MKKLSEMTVDEAVNLFGPDFLPRRGFYTSMDEGVACGCLLGAYRFRSGERIYDGDFNFGAEDGFEGRPAGGIYGAYQFGKEVAKIVFAEGFIESLKEKAGVQTEVESETPELVGV